MAETIKTPFGTYPKKKVLIGGAIVAGILAVMVYRARQASTTGAIPDAEINPATGYPYGSAEDAAALASQAGYVSASGSGGGSVSSPEVPGQGFVTNAQWSQAVVTYLVNEDLVLDPTQLTEALGRYLAGLPLSDTQVSLVNQAIAVEGRPPLAGDNGYPPAINHAGTVPGNSNGGAVNVLPAPGGFMAIGVGIHEIDFTWLKITGAARYEIQSTSPATSVFSFTNPVGKIYPLVSKTAYHWRIRTVNAANVPGAWSSSIQVTTH